MAHMTIAAHLCAREITGPQPSAPVSRVPGNELASKTRAGQNDDAAMIYTDDAAEAWL
ncbi:MULTISPECIES: hypothetical protein [Enterobacteriaceae]|uniref:Integrase n=1 Tax=Citrobacter bitternis TaxID=1585982 RepID=A0ABW1PXU4_9ENTR|nr:MULTISPECIES: hypothetical protein [Phytobacter]MDU4150129.1 hypothetical protein [Enterobacteriaceae bacterium]MDU7376859.1 hypothetical protein [Enterobacteriaceae bacterium]